MLNPRDFNEFSISKSAPLKWWLELSNDNFAPAAVISLFAYDTVFTEIVNNSYGWLKEYLNYFVRTIKKGKNNVEFAAEMLGKNIYETINIFLSNINPEIFAPLLLKVNDVERFWTNFVFMNNELQSNYIIIFNEELDEPDQMISSFPVRMECWELVSAIVEMCESPNKVVKRSSPEVPTLHGQCTELAGNPSGPSGYTSIVVSCSAWAQLHKVYANANTVQGAWIREDDDPEYLPDISALTSRNRIRVALYKRIIEELDAFEEINIDDVPYCCDVFPDKVVQTHVCMNFHQPSNGHDESTNENILFPYEYDFDLYDDSPTVFDDSFGIDVKSFEYSQDFFYSQIVNDIIAITDESNRLLAFEETLIDFDLIDGDDVFDFNFHHNDISDERSIIDQSMVPVVDESRTEDHQHTDVNERRPDCLLELNDVEDIDFLNDFDIYVDFFENDSENIVWSLIKNPFCAPISVCILLANLAPFIKVIRNLSDDFSLLMTSSLHHSEEPIDPTLIPQFLWRTDPLEILNVILIEYTTYYPLFSTLIQMNIASNIGSSNYLSLNLFPNTIFNNMINGYTFYSHGPIIILNFPRNSGGFIDTKFELPLKFTFSSVPLDLFGFIYIINPNTSYAHYVAVVKKNGVFYKCDGKPLLIDIREVMTQNYIVSAIYIDTSFDDYISLNDCELHSMIFHKEDFNPHWRLDGNNLYFFDSNANTYSKNSFPFSIDDQYKQSARNSEINDQQSYIDDLDDITSSINPNDHDNNDHQNIIEESEEIDDEVDDHDIGIEEEDNLQDISDEQILELWGNIEFNDLISINQPFIKNISPNKVFFFNWKKMKIINELPFPDTKEYVRSKPGDLHNRYFSLFSKKCDMCGSYLIQGEAKDMCCKNGKYQKKNVVPCGPPEDYAAELKVFLENNTNYARYFNQALSPIIKNSNVGHSIPSAKLTMMQGTPYAYFPDSSKKRTVEAVFSSIAKSTAITTESVDFLNRLKWRLYQDNPIISAVQNINNEAEVTMSVSFSDNSSNHNGMTMIRHGDEEPDANPAIVYVIDSANKHSMVMTYSKYFDKLCYPLLYWNGKGGIGKKMISTNQPQKKEQSIRRNWIIVALQGPNSFINNCGLLREQFHCESHGRYRDEELTYQKRAVLNIINQKEVENPDQPNKEGKNSLFLQM